MDICKDICLFLQKKNVVPLFMAAILNFCVKGRKAFISEMVQDRTILVQCRSRGYIQVHLPSFQNSFSCHFLGSSCICVSNAFLATILNFYIKHKITIISLMVQDFGLNFGRESMCKGICPFFSKHHSPQFLVALEFTHF